MEKLKQKPYIIAAVAVVLFVSMYFVQNKFSKNSTATKAPQEITGVVITKKSKKAGSVVAATANAATSNGNSGT